MEQTDRNVNPDKNVAIVTHLNRLIVGAKLL